MFFCPRGYLNREISHSGLTTVQKTADFFFFYTSPRIIIPYAVIFREFFISNARWRRSEIKSLVKSCSRAE